MIYKEVNMVERELDFPGFVTKWASKYPTDNDKLYHDNIHSGAIDLESFKKLFQWKNDPKIPYDKMTEKKKLIKRNNPTV